MHAHKMPEVFNCSEKIKYLDCSADFKIYVLNYQWVVPNDLQGNLNYTQREAKCLCSSTFPYERYLFLLQVWIILSSKPCINSSSVKPDAQALSWNRSNAESRNVFKTCCYTRRILINTENFCLGVYNSFVLRRPGFKWICFWQL